MSTAMDKFGEALGLWTIPKETDDEENIELKLQLGDGRKLRDIVSDKRNKDDRSLLFNRFSDFMLEIIKRDYPDIEEKNVQGYVELNLINLLDEAQVVFRLTTREQLKESKKEVKEKIKNAILNE